MPTQTKINRYTELLQNSINTLNQAENWTSFLETSARLYKYKFRDQALIHAQRPDATACADFDLWKRPDIADRHVKPGSKGIALLEDKNNGTNIRYVFDFSDTEAKSNKPFKPWQINGDNKSSVSKMLKMRHGAESDKLVNAIFETAAKFTADYSNDYANELIDYTEGSFFEGEDDYSVWAAFSQTLENSIAYGLLSRCGYNPKDYLNAEDFEHLYNFNTVETMTILGRSVSDLSETVLRDIERTVKIYERTKNNEQSVTENSTQDYGRNAPERDETGIPIGRENTNKSSNIDSGENPDIEQIRKNEGELPQKSQTDTVRNNVNQGDITEPLDGNRQRGEPPIGTDNDGNSESRGNRRETESDRPIEVDGADELPQTDSGGNNLQGTNPQLTADGNSDGGISMPEPQKQTAAAPAQLSLFGEEEPTPVVEHSETVKQLQKLREQRIDEKIVKAELMRGSSFQDGKFRIAEFAETNPSIKDFAKFLRDEYGTGGHSGDDIVKFCNHDSKGIHIELRDSERIIDITWKNAAKRIGELIKNGEYITDDDVQARIKHYQYVYNNYSREPDSADKFYFDKAVKVLEQYGLLEKGEAQPQQLEPAQPPPENKAADISGVEDVQSEYVFKIGDIIEIEAGVFEITGVGEVLEITDTTTDEVTTITEDELYENGFVLLEEADEQLTADKSAPENPEPVKPVDISETSEIPEPIKTVDTSETPEVPEPVITVDTPESDIDPHSLIGKHYTIDGREMVVDKVNTDWNKVDFADVAMFQSGYPLFRTETVDFLLYLEQQERESAVEPDITDIAVTEPDEPDIIIAPIFPNLQNAAEPEPTAEPQFKGDNFRITDNNLGVGGAKEKFKNNIAAIELLKEIELAQWNADHAIKPDRQPYATPEEQEILSKYVGWGGLAQAFDENNDSWANEYRILKNTLSDGEYESARASTLNAHYTSPTVIKAVYEGLENLGFKTGNVLEPAMGVGNFFGMLPENMSDSKLYGVELDDVSGRIAKLLYPNSDISIRGFEDKGFSDNFFDVAVGNVPFGGYGVSDKRYDKLKLQIHDYFFAKSLDKVRPGGVVAFVTSKGTLDKQNSSFRKYLAERADLIGAVRLPNTAFKANAGTEVTSDIIFLQKRDKVIDVELQDGDNAEWVKIGKYISPENAAKIAEIEAEIAEYRETNASYGISWETRLKNNEAIDRLTKELDEFKAEVSLPCNKYFLNNPDMVLGTIVEGNKLYGDKGNTDTMCIPFEGADLSEQLKAAIANIKGNIPEYEHKDEKVIDSIAATDDVRNFSFTVVDDKLYYRENSRMNRLEFPKMTEERIKAMVELRDCVRDLIDLQLNEYSESDIVNQQFKLNSLYDKFNKKYGLINSSANRNAFNDDSGYYLLSALEVIDEHGKLERKADMFTKRTIKQRKVVTSVDTASEALAVSIGEKAGVDLDFMSELSGLPREKIIEDLHGVIYQVPYSDNYVTADEYLSGNIREKLESARNSGMTDNIKALEQAMPKPLEACDIDVRLGATWLEPEIIKDFICETLRAPYHVKQSFNVKYSKYTAEWNIEGKNNDVNNVLANTTYGTSRKNAYAIIEDTLNLRDTRVYDRVDDKSVLNKQETMLAQEKQELVKQAFKDWIFKEPERRQSLVEKYNVLFNSTRPREYDGSHINFIGMNPEIEMRQHQKNAVAHGLYGGNTLLAHVVGAGKTYEMIALAMESKRLGLCNKSLIVVPNHITEQFGSDFQTLYPAANILVATKKDFEAKNRRRLCAKIATGDYDAVIIGHSQLEKIPISQERQIQLIEKQIFEITQGISELKGRRNEKFNVKQLEKTKRTLQTRLKKLSESPKRDNVVNFEELGIDKLFIDEAHNFKNLYLYTKMRNVAGISQTEAQKSTDLYLKCQYLDELTGGKGTIFATGTPISNSMTEMYTMQRYLQAGMLRKSGLEHFDAWAGNFGETVNSLELAPEGGGYRSRTRFAKFFNLPELMNMFKHC